MRKSCADANMAYSRTESVFILEHCFASKSFAAIREAFGNAYPDKEVPNKTSGKYFSLHHRVQTGPELLLQ
jgi:hypothetical protein